MMDWRAASSQQHKEKERGGVWETGKGQKGNRNPNPKPEMAEHLASIFGTEKDRVNCPFYFKIGACRHGDRCSRLHTKPTISPTLVLSNMYQRPDMNLNFIANPSQPQPPQPQSLDPEKLQDHFDVSQLLLFSCSLISNLILSLTLSPLFFFFDFVLFQDFYEDLFEELSKYGPIQSLNICDNLADHMVSLIPPSLYLSFVHSRNPNCYNAVLFFFPGW